VSRRTTRTVDVRSVTGWFTEDFTLAELKTLRARERLPRRTPRQHLVRRTPRVPTFDEVLCLVEEESRRRGSRIGVYPESKHPALFDSIGHSLEEPLVATLRRHRLDRPDAPVFVQSFEAAGLRELASMVRVPLVKLVDPAGAAYDRVRREASRRPDIARLD
jgi:glycerophosphoryl diester phosphodiesterase